MYSPWNSLGQNTGVGSLFLLQGIFPPQRSNPGLPHCRQIVYQLSHKGSPRILEWVAYPFSSGSSWPRNQMGVSCIAGGFFTNWAIREPTVHMVVYNTSLFIPANIFFMEHLWGCTGVHGPKWKISTWSFKGYVEGVRWNDNVLVVGQSYQLEVLRESLPEDENRCWAVMVGWKMPTAHPPMMSSIWMSLYLGKGSLQIWLN